MTSTRHRIAERMDDPRLDQSEHRRALRGLARLNRLSGVAGVLYRQLAGYAQRVAPRPLTVLDVASGSGDLPIQWARRAQRESVAIEITASDVSPVAVAAIDQAVRQQGVPLEARQLDCLAKDDWGRFDVVCCSLFLHHLDDPEAAHLLRSMTHAAQLAAVVCDLDRSGSNLALVWLASRLVTRSPVVHHDAVASIRGAYTRSELQRLAQTSLQRRVDVKSLFPCRFQLTIEVAESAALPKMPGRA